MNERTFECPKCHVADNNFTVNLNEEERIEVEKNYNEKVEEFKKIIEEHNKNLKDEYYEEDKVVHFLGFFPVNEKVKKLKIEYGWILNESVLVSDRGGIWSFISEYDCTSYGMALYKNYPVDKKYKVVKYNLYRHIECKTCGHKQYF